MRGAELVVEALRREGTELVFAYPGAAVTPLLDACAGRRRRTGVSAGDRTQEKPMRGTEVVVEAFRREKVDLVFGYPGGALLPFFDELARAPGLRIVLPRHEQAGAHAAEGYARATGKVGVCIGTSGPGATNLLTGIADAHMDSVPLVAITGQVKTGLIGNDAFQEVDVVGLTRSISKHNYLVKNPEELPFVLRAAFHVARSGRPGPVVVDLPVDVQGADVKTPLPDAVRLQSYQPTYIGNPRAVERAAQMINAADAPVFYVGGGLVTSELAAAEIARLGLAPDADFRPGSGRTAWELLRAAADRARIPVTTTLMALGCFPTGDPLSLGMLGMHGTAYANQAVQQCDLLIAVGARFDDRITGRVASFAPRAKIIHIDIDPTSVGKNVRVDMPIIGDAAAVLAQLLPRLEARPRDAWHAKIADWKARFPLDDGAGGDPAAPLKPQRVIRAVGRHARADGRDPVFCTEVGQHQMWAALHLPFDKPRQWISSGGLGTMGFGLPAAIGAQLGCPDKLVVDIAGDGSIQMNIQELATLRAQRLPVKIVVVDNGYLGMVRQWQQLFWERRYTLTDLSDNPDFVKVAEAFGLAAFRAETAAELDAALEAAFRHPGPALVDAVVAREENVYPMVPAGEPLDRFLLNQD